MSRALPGTRWLTLLAGFLVMANGLPGRTGPMPCTAAEVSEAGQPADHGRTLGQVTADSCADCPEACCTANLACTGGRTLTQVASGMIPVVPTAAKAVVAPVVPTLWSWLHQPPTPPPQAIL